MALTSRYRSAPTAGFLAALVLVLAFGNPAYVSWAQENADPQTAGGWFLRLLTWPAWRFSADDSVGNVFADDLKAILLVILTWVFLTLLPGSQLARARGTASQLLAGWGGFIFAGAFAGLLTAFIQTNPTLLAAFQAAGSGAIYGLFVGWIVGLAALGGYRGAD
ncbi:hypothetical protein F4553_006357 [Allocatelliglobosispora scoriae]|uniref:Uncharacterized protein n=1 Tax=Allocatelliglobosispora scoriae TaxID=643052 RepID=A0A841C1A4_9ACTN|nr:hypothetical protein [Allocatelliglobosispora scoriae]MBB5872923.1 hypothetical protein [Allocatelliglobosispora scoriae]